MHANAENAEYQVRHVIPQFDTHNDLLGALRQSSLVSYYAYHVHDFQDHREEPE